MKFLLDANMPHSTLAVFREYGHTAKHVRDIGMGDAPDHRRDAAVHGLSRSTRFVVFSCVFRPTTASGQQFT
ncbi:DUF5615 family PIN-like protein [Candidatus Thiosymbion oneisti]|uniref:DUF5615 family PIN-like protein n=2 Tax=Candidatus Thiosymbion oneisti TaxID=589554 RepID=UPI0013FDB96E